MPDVTSIFDLGWRQGSIVSSAVVAAIPPKDIHPALPEDNAHLIVITQSCDVVHSSYEDEPLVEVLRARPISDSERRSDWLAGKDPRRLQVRMRNESGTFYAEARAHDRYLFPRHALESGAPSSDITVDDDSLDRIPEWLAKRYSRAAFPNAFNNRTSAARAKLARLIEKKWAVVNSIHVELDQQVELTADESYRVGVNVIVKSAASHDDRVLAEMQLVTARIEKLFAESDGIEVVYCKLIPTSQFTIDDLAETDELDLDYLSYRGQYKQ